MPTEDQRSDRSSQQGVPQSVLGLMPPFKILATTVGAALLMWGMLFAYTSSPAWAADITVNSLADDADGADGECSLREAITSANTDTASGTATGECAAGSGDDEIHFALPGTAPWTVDLTTALPNLSTNIDILGPGANQFTVRRPATEDEQYRIFTVSSTTNVEVSISGMTITGGNTRGDGGGILSFTELGSDTTTTTTITNSTIFDNTGNRGGGVANVRGTMTITGSTIGGTDDFGNTAPDAGGGVYSQTNLNSSQKTTITNSTISGNEATTFVGGGIYNFGGLTAIEFSTITLNTARGDGDGSGVFSFGDSSTRTEVLSTIISANQGTDVDSHATSSFLSGGFNLIGDGNATGSFNQTGDQTGVIDPGLDPLGSYGGPTQTHRLHSDSPALDAALRCPPPATDQRGVSRPQGSACDIGSFELEKSDTEAPKVISTFPRNGGEVGPARDVTATFSEDMREASVINAFKLFRKGSTNQIDATVTYDADTNIATLNPTNNLRRGVTYKAVVTTVAKDMAGNRLDQNASRAGLQQKVWFFEIDN